MNTPLRLHIECPKCGKRPRVRVDPEFAALLALVAERLEIDESSRTLTCYSYGRHSS